MPYSLDKPDDLPANVQKMSDADKKKWVSVFNSAFEDCEGDDCDAEATKAANASVKKEKSSIGITINVREAASMIVRALAEVFGLDDNAPAREPSVDEAIAAVRAVSFNDIFKQVLDQGYEAYPSAWLNDLYDDNGTTFAVFAQDGMLYRSPVALVDGKAQLGEWKQVVVEFADAPSGETPEVKPIYNDMMWLAKHPRSRSRTSIIREKDGKVRWLSVSCTAVLNRVGEIDSTDLFKSFEDNFKTRSPNDPPALRNFFHAGSPFRTGVVEWVAADGYCFLTSGLFDDSDIARAEIAARESRPDYWGESIEYTPTADPVMLRVGDGISIPTYNAGIFTGVACLPEDKAAALFTVTSQEVIRMLNKDQMTALVELFGGNESAAKDWLEKNPDALNRMIPQAGLIARAAQPTPAAVVPEAGAPATPPAVPATVVVLAETTPIVSTPATQERELVLDEEAMEEISNHILASPALAGVPAALAELVQSVAQLSQNISARSTAQDKTLGDIAERLETLEQDDEAKRTTWIQDLPAAARQPARTRVSFRPREARAPSTDETTLDSAAIAETTLAGAKTRNAR